MKYCSKCGLDKDESCFYKDKSGKYISYCKDCRKTIILKWKIENLDRVKQHESKRTYNILRKFITDDALMEYCGCTKKHLIEHLINEAKRKGYKDFQKKDLKSLKYNIVTRIPPTDFYSNRKRFAWYNLTVIKL